MSRIARHANRLVVLAVFITSVVGVMAVGAAQTASAATTTITSSGPLTSIGISTDLNCSVNHTGDTSGEFYGGTACGTLVVLAGVLYGPASIPAGGSATGSSGYTAFTPVSQTPVSGAGTSASPYSITTVVDLGATGFRLTETDTYVVGQEAYLTNVSIHNSTGSGQAATIYRAGDCYLQNSDTGLGQIDGSAVACKASPSSVSPNRIEQWYPITPGSHYMEDNFDTVWSTIGQQQAFADTCQCTSDIDNGAGLSWSLTIGAGATTAVQQYTTFSPLGIQPITVTKTADSASATPGGSDGYTISIANPGSTAVNLDTITDSLPAGFTYTGPTTGDVTANPTVAGQTLTWAGPIAIGAGATLHMHFNVTVSTTPGTYTNSATATGNGLIIIGATDVAPVTVAGAAATTTTAAPATPVTATPAFTG